MTESNTKLAAKATRSPRAGVGREPKSLKTEANMVSLTVRVDAKLKATLQRIANKDGRTLNNWITQALKKAAAT